MLNDLLQELGADPAAAYPRVIAAALIAAGAVIVLHLLIALLRGATGVRPKWNWLSRLIYLGFFASVAVLAGTSFYAVIAHGAMHGWFLLLHLFGAGAFVVLLPLIALQWSFACRFFQKKPQSPVPADPALPPALARKVNPPRTPPQRFSWLGKLAFWLILISGVATAGSMLLSMLPLLGTDDMLAAINVHRYAGLVCVVALMVHFYTVLLGKMGRG
jgi:hypothetical protein